MSFQTNNNKKITCVSLEVKTIELLKRLKKEKYIKSISQGVRQLVSFALPYFLTACNIDILEKTYNNNNNNTPTKLSLDDLKKKYPNIPDYKFICEA